MNEIMRSKKRLIIVLFFFLSGILSASWNARIPDVQQELALNDAAWGIVLFSLPAGLVAGLFFSGWLVTRFGSGSISILTTVLAALLLPLLGWASDRLLLMFFLFLVGFNRTIMNISINTRSVEVQQLYERPILSSFHGIWSMACLLAAGIAQIMLLMGVIPFLHFLIVAVLCLAGVFFTLQWRGKDHVVPEKKPFLVKPDRYLLLLGFIAFFSMSAENTMFDWSINYFDKVIQADKEWRTLGYTCFIITMSAGRFAGDWLVGKFGVYRVLFFNGLLMAAGFSFASFLPFLFTACLGFLMVGFGDSSIVPILYAMARKSRIPVAYSIASVTSIGYLGFLVNPLIFGSLSYYAGMQWAMGLMIIFSLLVCWLTMLLQKRSLKENQEEHQRKVQPDT